jgi:hypothetical protein
MLIARVQSPDVYDRHPCIRSTRHAVRAVFILPLGVRLLAETIHLKSPLVVPSTRNLIAACNGCKLPLLRSSPNTEPTTMAVPANPGSVMELDPGEENVSFLVRVIPHPRMCYFKATPAKFRSLVRFCFAIVDMIGQPTSRRRTTCRQDPRVVLVDGQRHSPCSIGLGNCRSMTRRSCSLQRGTGIAQHERRRVLRNFKVHAYIRHSFPSSHLEPCLLPLCFPCSNSCVSGTTLA